MKAKCKKCGDTIEVTRLREFKSCKCGAIALDYGDGYYYRVCGNPENFDGEIKDAPKELGAAKIEDLHKPEKVDVILNDKHLLAKATTTFNEPIIISRAEVKPVMVDNFWAEMAEHFKKLGKYSDLMVQKECFEALAKLCEEKSEEATSK